APIPTGANFTKLAIHRWVVLRNRLTPVAMTQVGERCIRGVLCRMVAWSVCHFTMGGSDGQKEGWGSRGTVAGDLTTSGGQRAVGAQVLCGGGNFRTVVLHLAEEAADAERHRRFGGSERTPPRGGGGQRPLV